MKRIPLLIVIAITLFITSCGKKHEPSPDDKISSMRVSARKVNNEVILDISALTFKSSVGPEPTTFEQAEVWISEEISGLTNMQLVKTTSDRTVKLENLKADKTYYVAVKGIKNSAKTDFSEPIMFSTRSLKPLSTLLELPNSSYMTSSYYSAYPYLAYVDNNSGELIMQNLNDKTKKVLYKNSAEKSYQVKGFYSFGTLLVLETARNGDRAFDYYDLLTNKFVEIAKPLGSRIWSYAFSPDGFKIAFTDYNSTGLYIYDIAINNVRRYSNDFFYDFDWAPDGKNIIEVKARTTGNTNAREVVKWDLSDSKITPVKLFEWPANIQNLSFSPNEEYALFASNVSNNADLWIYELKTGKTWQISDVANFGWISEKEFFVNANKTGTETTWKTYKYTIPN